MYITRTICSKYSCRHAYNSFNSSWKIHFRKLSDQSPSLIQDCQTYLNYCKINQVNLDTPVFRGTFYELYLLHFLQDYLHCRNLMKVGGAYDNGIDILGKWNLNHFYQRSDVFKSAKEKSSKIPTTSLLKQAIEVSDPTTSKSSISLENDINILVQCKNSSKKITAKVIRELTGIYYYHINGGALKSPSATKTLISTHYLFLVSPTRLTPQGIAQLDQSQIPIIHMRIDPLQHNPNKSIDEDSVYKLENWDIGGQLYSIYLNTVARKLLTGLKLELQLEALIKQTFLN
ncbi:hypothetical protein DFJ63DRAFT_221957 [Scheffersomyces coipomensis]|uniref:uncharacterized protein n=1 Tax=Scheffersomyces coipomensis TaxID=1788519 RepID=UPI00315D52B1